jgi:hypothetical protein
MEYIYTQGLTDKYWYYAPKSAEPIPVDAWTGPFLSRKSAVEHSQGLRDTQNYD